MAGITKEEIERIAGLARIRLTDEEKEKLSGEVGEILTYVGKLNEVDTKGMEPTSQVTGLENILRKDDIKTAHEAGQFSDALLAQAPEREGNYVKVRGVMESK